MLRPYQTEAIKQIRIAHEGGKTPLCVMATGTGKTHVFVEYAKQSEGRAMIIAERQEIVMQARSKIAATGETCEIEMGDLKVNDNLWGRPRFVCASIQTLNAQRNCGRRYAKFDWASLKLLVIDEAHHAVAKGYQRVIEHARKENPDIRIMGVTATPDRLDKRSMGNVFNEVAYRYEMDSAIKDGYLVPIRQHMVQVKSMDFSSARTTAGDLNAGDLDRIMNYERNLHGVCVPTMDLAGDRPTLVFAASINHAQRISEIINRHRPGQACFITGKTPSDERAELLKEFREGKYQFLVNVQIATEGWDCPPVACVAVARPTKSRALYTQMVGRGTRPMVPVTEDEAGARRQSIAFSTKPDCLVLDFVGNSGRHQLVCSIDILKPSLPKEVRESVKVRVEALTDEGEHVAPSQLDRIVAEEEEAYRRSRVVASVQYNTSDIDPFTMLGIKAKPLSKWSNTRQLTEKQTAILVNAGINVNNMPIHQQRQAIEKIFERSRKGLCSMKQMALLCKFGYSSAEVKTWTRQTAGATLDQIRNNGWKATN